jgi:hypothetical protein
MPPYVCIPSIPNEYAGSGYLSTKYGPFSLGSDPANGGFAVRDLALAQGIDEHRFDRRKDMLTAVDSHFRTIEKSDALSAMDTFYQRAYSLISAKSAREAFDLKSEPEAIKEQYGKNQAGMRMLLARRLVEGGVRFVSMTYGGWDYHSNIKQGFEREMPAFDKAFAALIRDLEARKLLDSTLVMVSSEFGRTPKINKDAGRDHWGPAGSLIFAGGGVKPGNVIGATDKQGAYVTKRPVSPADVACTVFDSLGIDPRKQLVTPDGRPVEILDQGELIKELF